MKLITTGIVGACVLFSGAAYAQSGESVVKSKGCLNCHSATTKVAPEFKAIAAKNKDNKGAQAAFVSKLKDGKNHPKIQAPDAELQAAVQYVLKQ